jgi:hypothetical protein
LREEQRSFSHFNTLRLKDGFDGHNVSYAMEL